MSLELVCVFMPEYVPLSVIDRGSISNSQQSDRSLQLRQHRNAPTMKCYRWSLHEEAALFDAWRACQQHQVVSRHHDIAKEFAKRERGQPRGMQATLAKFR